MKSNKSAFGVKGKRSGSAIVVLIVLVVVVCVILVAKMVLKEKPQDANLVEGLTPWKEWRMRQTWTEPPAEPSAEQAQIPDFLSYDTNVKLKDATDPRGELMLSLAPDGEVSGGWYGSYYKKPKINFDIMGGGFGGRTYPGKMYKDVDGEDPSKLYYICAGKFSVQETDMDKGTVFQRVGELYVKGWINPDLSVTGEIYITSDEKYFETFTWVAKQPLP